MKKVALILASAALLTIFASCGSTPEPETTEPEAPVVQEVVEEEKEPEENIEQEEPVEFDNEGLLARIEEARKAAIEAGAEKEASEMFKLIDTLYGELKNADGDISKSANDVEARYKALTSYVQAKKEKQKIDKNGFAEYDQKDYDAGCEYLQKVEDAYAAGEWNQSVADNAESAYGKFKNVTFAAYKKLAMEEREAAFGAKKDADSVKAGVSRKEQYKAAAELFKGGDQLYAIQNPEKAYENYKSAKEQFASLYKDVAAKRAQAQKKLDEAKKAVEESASFAAEADEKTPILDSEEIEGIEEASTVLLEEDNYEAPEEAEIDIPEAIDDNGNAIEVEPEETETAAAEEPAAAEEE